MSAATVSPIKPPASPVGQLDPATTLIRISDVQAIVGLARPTIYKLMRQPESGFPLPVKLSDSTARGAPVAWVLAEVQQWVRSRIAARGSAAA
ncbi:AlpA family phage regulatory protein [Pseudomonas sp. WS 5011]|uniref:helix-turn-helix transcriptional regulator n=1 Tax=Pseudomonas sp. WS 5011 TaxID=2717477 RepID=UPI001473FCD9|nr:AlpA family phage regulatory protein [Pseudomonas sp. WS 5011]NMY53230.1 AlpA family phage regulatory protein [Pseudomonas sp. WS 5011]